MTLKNPLKRCGLGLQTFWCSGKNGIWSWSDLDSNINADVYSTALGSSQLLWVPCFEQPDYGCDVASGMSRAFNTFLSCPLSQLLVRLHSKDVCECIYM